MPNESGVWFADLIVGTLRGDLQRVISSFERVYSIGDFPDDAYSALLISLTRLHEFELLLERGNEAIERGFVTVDILSSVLNTAILCGLVSRGRTAESKAINLLPALPAEAEIADKLRTFKRLSRFYERHSIDEREVFALVSPVPKCVGEDVGGFREFYVGIHEANNPEVGHEELRFIFFVLGIEAREASALYDRYLDEIADLHVDAEHKLLVDIRVGEIHP